jgi:hypothetical protein
LHTRFTASSSGQGPRALGRCGGRRGRLKHASMLARFLTNDWWRIHPVHCLPALGTSEAFCFGEFQLAWYHLSLHHRTALVPSQLASSYCLSIISACIIVLPLCTCPICPSTKEGTLYLCIGACKTTYARPMHIIRSAQLCTSSLLVQAAPAGWVHSPKEEHSG